MIPAVSQGASGGLSGDQGQGPSKVIKEQHGFLAKKDVQSVT